MLFYAKPVVPRELARGRGTPRWRLDKDRPEISKETKSVEPPVCAACASKLQRLPFTLRRWLDAAPKMDANASLKCMLKLASLSATST